LLTAGGLPSFLQEIHMMYWSIYDRDKG